MQAQPLELLLEEEDEELELDEELEEEVQTRTSVEHKVGAPVTQQVGEPF